MNAERISSTAFVVFLVAFGCDGGNDEALREAEQRIGALEAEATALIEAANQCRRCDRRSDAALRAYHQSGAYEAGVAAVVDAARDYLEEQLEAKKGDRPTLALDVDETALSSYPELVRTGFCYDAASWDRWVARGNAAAIEPTLELFGHAKGAGIEVVFITGRRESQREATRRALEAAGYSGYASLVLRTPRERELSAAEYKTRARKRLEKQGRTILATLGDQRSDVEGEAAGRGFLLPNPFYVVP